MGKKNTMKPKSSRVYNFQEQPPAWVEDYIGIPFSDRGRSKEGCDCYGLVRMVLYDMTSLYLENHIISQHNHDAVDFAINSEKATGEWREITQNNEKAFDVAQIIIPIAGSKTIFRPLHIALVVANGWLLHTEEETASHLVNRLSPVWRRIHAFWRHQWLDDEY
jgi:hypothetical protein